MHKDLTAIKDLLRRHPEWPHRRDHRRMLNGIIRRIRGERNEGAK